MHRSLRGLACAILLGVCVAACAVPPLPAPHHEEPHVRVPPSAGIYKIGNPYEQAGTWYYPHEQPDYDETGVASWYGPEFAGQRTANGELFDPEGITAAHRTLPMPVNVRVTNLENGRSIMVRVNDRGPFARGRIIDVSRHAARLLGFLNQGTARVRVTYLEQAPLGSGEIPQEEVAPEITTAMNAAPTGKVDAGALNIVPGAAVAPPVKLGALPAALPPPPSAAQTQADDVPNGKVTHIAVPSETHLYIQAGAFSSESNADRLKERLAAVGGVFVSTILRDGQRLYRVRMGPFDQVTMADAALARIARMGGDDAQIVVDR